MEKEKNKIIDAVAKIIKDTQDGVMKWKSVPEHVVRAYPDDIIDSVFVSDYKGQRLRIHVRSFKSTPRPDLKSFGGFDADQSKWKSLVVLELVDGLGNTLWNFPSVDLLNDLLASVQYQIAGVEKYLDDILKD